MPLPLLLLSSGPLFFDCCLIAAAVAVDDQECLQWTTSTEKQRCTCVDIVRCIVIVASRCRSVDVYQLFVDRGIVFRLFSLGVSLLHLGPDHCFMSWTRDILQTQHEEGCRSGSRACMDVHEAWVWPLHIV